MPLCTGGRVDFEDSNVAVATDFKIDGSEMKAACLNRCDGLGMSPGRGFDPFSAEDPPVCEVPYFISRIMTLSPLLLLGVDYLSVDDVDSVLELPSEVSSPE
jgi:hypothetical protein